MERQNQQPPLKGAVVYRMERRCKQKKNEGKTEGL